MSDIKMRRNGMKVFISAESVRGAVWMLENIMRPQAVSMILDAELAEDIKEDFRSAGLEVEGP